MAVEHAKRAHILSSVERTWHSQQVGPTVGLATGDNLVHLQAWKKQIECDVNNINASLG